MEKKENGSILLAPPPMRHILASLDSVASAADRIQKEANLYNVLLLLTKILNTLCLCFCLCFLLSLSLSLSVS